MTDAACAIACRADALVFLTDVPREPTAEASRWLSIDQIAEMAEERRPAGTKPGAAVGRF